VQICGLAKRIITRAFGLHVIVTVVLLGCFPVHLWFRSATRYGVWTSPRQAVHADVFLFASKAPVAGFYSSLNHK